MFIFGKFDGQAFESEQADNQVKVGRCQAGVGVESEGVFLQKANYMATG